MISVENAISKIVNRQQNMEIIEKQRQSQRRNTVSDAKADFLTMLRSPTRIYTGFTISKDIQFIMRYGFSLHVRPYVTSYASEITTENTSLAIANNSINPNPHSHKVLLVPKFEEKISDPSTIRISINKIDITDALKLEYGGSFVDGFGYFPKEEGSFFDVLKILDYLAPWEQSAILSHGRKEIEISQNNNNLCECDISYDIKFNHVDRGGLM